MFLSVQVSKHLSVQTDKYSKRLNHLTGAVMNKDVKIQVRLTKEQYRELKRLSSHTTMSTFIVSGCFPKEMHNANCQCKLCTGGL